MKMKAALGRCEDLSERRNRLLHNAIAIMPDGSLAVQGASHAWGPAPTVTELEALVTEIAEQVEVLNQERLRGFIHEVCEAAQPSAPET